MICIAPDVSPLESVLNKRFSRDPDSLVPLTTVYEVLHEHEQPTIWQQVAHVSLALDKLGLPVVVNAGRRCVQGIREVACLV